MDALLKQINAKPDTYKYSVEGSSRGYNLLEVVTVKKADTHDGVYWQMWYVRDYFRFLMNNDKFKTGAFDRGSMCEVIAVLRDSRVSPIVKYAMMGQLQAHQDRDGIFSPEAEAELQDFQSDPANEITPESISQSIHDTQGLNGHTPKTPDAVHAWVANYVANFR